MASETRTTRMGSKRMAEQTEKLANIAVCTVGDIGVEIAVRNPQGGIAALNEYLSQFAAPANSAIMLLDECLNCGNVGTFQWGIARGEGNCCSCGWPSRAFHDPKNADGPILVDRFVAILQYHPSHVGSRNGE